MNYGELLSGALEAPEHGDPRASLLESLVAARPDHVAATPRQYARPNDQLALELAYDQALITISSAMDVETSPGNFSDRIRERNRLEHELAELESDWKRHLYPQVTRNLMRLLAPPEVSARGT